MELFRQEKSVDAMGSTFSVILYGNDNDRMEAALDAAFKDVRRLDEMLSDYRDESEWRRVNRMAGRQAVRVSPELYQLLSRCLEYSRRSEGAFDISVGPLVKTWGFFRGTGRLPTRAEVRSAKELVGFRHIRLDPVSQTVGFDRPGVEINSGGVGKGYAVDRIVAILRDAGFESALVAASFSSIYGLGTPPSDSEGWRVAIRDPRDARKSAAEVSLKNVSISTSGSSERFFWARGRSHSHIIDPRTGWPADGVAQVSVVAPLALESEAWAKACFVNGRQWAGRNRPSEFRVFLYSAGEDRTCNWL